MQKLLQLQNTRRRNRQFLTLVLAANNLFQGYSHNIFTSLSHLPPLVLNIDLMAWMKKRLLLGGQSSTLLLRGLVRLDTEPTRNHEKVWGISSHLFLLNFCTTPHHTKDNSMRLAVSNKTNCYESKHAMNTACSAVTVKMYELANDLILDIRL